MKTYKFVHSHFPFYKVKNESIVIIKEELRFSICFSKSMTMDKNKRELFEWYCKENVDYYRDFKLRLTNECFLILDKIWGTTFFF